MFAWVTRGVCLRLPLVDATIFCGLNGYYRFCYYFWRADDDYSELSACAIRGVYHRVSLDCTATMGMMFTMMCLLGPPMVLIDRLHWFDWLCHGGFHRCHWFVRLHFGGPMVVAMQCSSVVTGFHDYILVGRWWLRCNVCLGNLWCSSLGITTCVATTGGPLDHLAVRCFGYSCR